MRQASASEMHEANVVESNTKLISVTRFWIAGNDMGCGWAH